MAEKSRDPHITALEAVYAALKDLDPGVRKKVLSSVFALLELETPPVSHPTTASLGGEARQQPPPASAVSRPISLVELINDKKPGTNAQRIAIFAYYREKTENQARFAREDLKHYFATAKQPPASNFDRDFVEAVKKGWIHEDGADSYLTTKGIEAIESSFEGERKYTQGKGKKSKKGNRPKPNRKRKS